MVLELDPEEVEDVLRVTAMALALPSLPLEPWSSSNRRPITGVCKGHVETGPQEKVSVLLTWMLNEDAIPGKYQTWSPVFFLAEPWMNHPIPGWPLGWTDPLESGRTPDEPGSRSVIPPVSRCLKHPSSVQSMEPSQHIEHRCKVCTLCYHKKANWKTNLILANLPGQTFQ